jgi:preprotein translocase subunit YajC
MLTEILISDSFAQEAASAAATQEFSLSSFVPLIAIFVIFYFLIIRPQSKKIKEHQLMVNALKSGNKVITSGGIVGVVTEVHQKEGEVEVEIAKDVVIRVLKNHVSEVIKPAEKKSKEDKKSKK